MDRQDIYTRVTDAIVSQLEQGARPWAPRWEGAAISGLPLRSNGQAYRGVNVLLLWGSAVVNGFSERRWLTFKQAQELGAHVRKGERGSTVVYAGRIEREREGQDGAEVETIPFMRGYSVFNVQQIEGLGPEWFAPPAPAKPEPPRDAAADAAFHRAGVTICHGGGAAFYDRSADRVQMPPLAAFGSSEAYYATLAHECVHWTGHESRLARTFGKRFGDKAYAVEELVAEMGAAFLCGALGLSAEPRADHASYLQSWLDVLKADKRAIFTAASAAQAACDLLSPQQEAASALAA